MLLIIFLIGLISIVFSVVMALWVMKQPAGTEKMQSIAAAIEEGAKAYMKRQYKTVTIFSVIVAALLWIFLGVNGAVTFILGAFLSALAGYAGMSVAVKANVRTANAASSVESALKVALTGGAVTGLSIVGLGLAGISALYYFYHDPAMIIGFGFGASLVSLFARVGGGIFTKAADVGADLVGKIEKGIPEDDPRNPAVIADNVGDNVGDDAGMGADLFESYIVTILAAMLLGVALGINSIVFPLALSAVGIIASIIGVFFIFVRKGKDIWQSLTQGILVSAVLSIIGFYIVSQYFMGSMALFYAGVIGIVAAVLILYVTGHYTSRDKKSVYEIAKSSETGAATNIIFGLALGMRSVFIPMLIMVAAIFLSFMFAGVYGIAIAAVGLLSLTGIIMSIDAYGPISDNAGGIAEMAHMPKDVRQVTDALDAVGNTTKATTKGIAIASAAISALALFAAFAQSAGLQSIDLMKVKVLVGLLIGGALPFLFSSFLMRAVGNASYSVVKEVRRQFKEIKGLMQGKAKPDYAQCVDICTKSALKELAKPALLAVISPVVVGFLLGAEALAGLLAGSIVSGFLLAIMLCTGGAAWDNAKKFIEIGNFGGKGSDAHKAAVVGDTVGDPAKDTAGPSLNALIKVLNTLSILIGVMLVI